MVKTRGFTLAELLIALAILGVVATFTIPKVLQSQQDAKLKAIGKEAAAMISGAYSAYQLNNTLSSSTGPTDLLSFMNYVRLDTASTLDGVHGSAVATISCATVNRQCIRLHNGGTLFYGTDVNFGGTATTNAIWFILDPDTDTNDVTTTNGPGKSITFFIYYGGRLTSYGGIENNTTVGNWAASPVNPTPSFDPPWFGNWN